MGHFQTHDSQSYTLTLDSGLLSTSYPFSESYHPSQHRIIDIKDIIDLLLRNYQGMPQGYRIDIEESKKLIVFRNLVVTFALLMGGAGFIYNLSPFGADLINGAPLSMAIMGCIGTILFIGIPIFSLIYAICCQLFKVRPLPTQARWILLALWLISLVLCGVYIHQSGMLYDWHDYWNGVHGWNRHAVWLP